MNGIDEPVEILQFVFYMNVCTKNHVKKAINHVKNQSSLFRRLESSLFFSSFAFIYICNTLAKVIAPSAESIYVFEGEIRKASTFWEAFLVKPPESLITFKQLNAAR